MNSSKRSFLRGAAVLALVASAGFAQAQDASNKAIRLIVGYAPGGTTDMLARLAAAGLGERLHRTVIVENHPGADGAIAMNIVLQAPADGSCLLVSSSGAITLDPYIRVPRKLDPIATLAPVGVTARFPVVMVAATNAPFDTTAQLLALAKSQPDKLSYASSGNGSLNNLSGELFKMRTGVKIVHVPYKGDTASLADLIGGNVSFAIYPLPVALPLIQSGKLKALAIMDATRSTLLPNVSTLVEQGLVGYDAGSWIGVFARAGTGSAVVGHLNETLNALFSSAKLQTQLAASGMVHEDLSPAAFGALVKSESTRWRATAARAGVSLSD